MSSPDTATAALHNSALLMTPPLEPFVMELYPAVERAFVVKRHNRFVAAVRRVDDAVEDVHVPNSGRLPELMEPGLPCLTARYGGARKYPASLVAVRHNEVWVLIDTLMTNRIAGRLLTEGRVPGLDGYSSIRAEVVHRPPGHTGTTKGLPRFDFRLDGHPTRSAPCWVEVKSVTLARGRHALFPDAVTTRGARHVRELAALAAVGERAVVLFLVQRSDPEIFAPNEETDPAFAEALRSATGLEIVVLRLRLEIVDASLRATLDRPLPHELTPRLNPRR